MAIDLAGDWCLPHGFGKVGKFFKRVVTHISCSYLTARFLQGRRYESVVRYIARVRLSVHENESTELLSTDSKSAAIARYIFCVLL